jgi:hypothetical protein
MRATPSLPVAARGAVAVLLALLGCAPLDHNTRTERGPLLRTFDRDSATPGGVRGEVDATWPTLKLRLTGYDTCRVEKIEEYAEETITEHTATSAGPTLSMGISATLAGGVLLALSPVFSGEPNRTSLDASGRYGAPPRSYVYGVSIGLFAVGVPALTVGLVQTLRTGIDTQVKKVEQVASQREATCHERLVDGPVQLVNERGGLSPARPSQGGVVAFDERELPQGFTAVRFADREVELDSFALQQVQGFSACVALAREKAPPLEAPTGTLVARREKLALCRALRGGAVDDEAKALDGELQKRREQGEPATRGAAETLGSYEEAVQAWAPSVRVSPETAENATPERLAALEGRAVILEGVVARGLTANIGVVQVGAHEVFVFLPTVNRWSTDFGNGTRVEAVAVVKGTQTVGEVTLPLLKAVWMRPAFGR